MEELWNMIRSLDALEIPKSVKKRIRQLVMTKSLYSVSPAPGHYIFTGNVDDKMIETARMMGQCMKKLGVLEDGHLVRCLPEDFLSEYLGQTSVKTRAICENALGGVLFVEEAHRLVNTKSTGEKFSSYSAREAYEELLIFMEINRNRVCVIFAGDEMKMRDFVDAYFSMERQISDVIAF